MKFEIIKVLKMSMLVSWEAKPCGFGGRYTILEMRSFIGDC
jgi:hypothetical protein